MFQDIGVRSFDMHLTNEIEVRSPCLISSFWELYIEDWHFRFSVCIASADPPRHRQASNNLQFNPWWRRYRWDSIGHHGNRTDSNLPKKLCRLLSFEPFKKCGSQASISIKEWAAGMLNLHSLSRFQELHLRHSTNLVMQVGNLPLKSIRDAMNNIMPAARALRKDMAPPVTYGTVSAAMEASARTIIATYTCAIPHERARVRVNRLFLQLSEILGIYSVCFTVIV